MQPRDGYSAGQSGTPSVGLVLGIGAATVAAALLLGNLSKAYR
jgi:hypothetical protein